MGKILDWIPNFWAHPVSAIGTVLTTITGSAILFVLGAQLGGAEFSVYTTGFLLITLPAGFVLGLLLIPLGMWLARRKKTGPRRTPGEAMAALFTTKRGTRILTVTALLTIVNIVLLGGIGHSALVYMDSPQFCGTMCHQVMQPEYDSYRESSHSRVACVECHIGPGASFAVRSKIDGLRQVWRTLTNTYERPVPTPVHTLRPSRDTCEKCHWPDKFHGRRVAYRIHHQPDEKNTPEVTMLALKLGGLDQGKQVYEGIHWHVRRDVEVRYEALDDKREVIGKITVMKDGKPLHEYLPTEATGAAVETRTMDCIDCHNRPTHIFDRSPARALDRAFVQGSLDASVPWLRALAEPLVAKADRKRDTVEADLRKELEAAYRAEHPDKLPAPEVLDAAAKGLGDLWKFNVYPARGVVWGTYPNHLGHDPDTSLGVGCFRCHDGKHKTADGKSLSRDCELCHEMLAQEEAPDDLDDVLKSLIPQR